MNINNRWALITGASRGVGKRVALALAKQGCKLILHSRSLKGTSDLQERLQAAGAEAHSVAAELSSISAVETLIE